MDPTTGKMYQAAVPNRVLDFFEQNGVPLSAAALAHSCPGLDSWLADEEIPIIYSARFREFKIVISEDDGIVMNYCPSCGAKLPSSLRDLWFDRMLAMGFDPPWDPRIPDAMHTDEWWRAEGL